MSNKEEPAAQPTTELLKRLSSAIGVSGYSGENNIQHVVSAECGPYVDQVRRDRLGSVVAIKTGAQAGVAAADRRRVMLAAHLDEIGAIVTKVDHGFIRFEQVGGLDDRLLMGQEVTVHGRVDLPGIIGSIPPHFQTGNDKTDQINRQALLIDVGLSPAQVAEQVRVGDLVSFQSTPADLLNGLVMGKAMDNRASLAAVIVCLRELQKIRHQWDVYAVATADEEWGNFVGATTQAYAIRPDVAIALDVTFADVNDLEVKLDQGPVIGLGPSNHPVVRQRLTQICRDLELKYQTEMMPSGAGTDAYAIEISREGIPTILVSVPSRYMHSQVEVVQPRDIERTGRLLAHFIASLDETFVAMLTPQDD